MSHDSRRTSSEVAYVGSAVNYYVSGLQFAVSLVDVEDEDLKDEVDVPVEDVKAEPSVYP